MGEILFIRLTIKAIKWFVKGLWWLLKMTGLGWVVVSVLIWENFISPNPVLAFVLDIPFGIVCIGGWVYIVVQNILRVVYRNPKLKLYTLLIKPKQAPSVYTDTGEENI